MQEFLLQKLINKVMAVRRKQGAVISTLTTYLKFQGDIHLLQAKKAQRYAAVELILLMSYWNKSSLLDNNHWSVCSLRMQISSDLFSTHSRTCHTNEKSTIILSTTPASHHWEGQGTLEQTMPWWRDCSCHCPCYSSRSWRKGFAFFLSVRSAWNKRQAARAKEGRKPFEVKRTEFQLLNDFMTTVSFKCWSLSRWL